MVGEPKLAQGTSRSLSILVYPQDPCQDPRLIYFLMKNATAQEKKSKMPVDEKFSKMFNESDNTFWVA